MCILHFEKHKKRSSVNLWDFMWGTTLVDLCMGSFNLLKPTGYVMHRQFNLLNPTGYVMHKQFNLLNPTGYVMHKQV